MMGKVCNVKNVWIERTESFERKEGYSCDAVPATGDRNTSSERKKVGA